jgi:hypothetical protein
MGYGGKKGKLPNTKSNSDPYAPHSNPNSGYNKKRDLSSLLVGGGKKPPKPPTSL